MSGFSGSTTCPNCGKECDEYTDSKPFSMTTMQCNYCGLLINPVITYMDLEELNDARRDSEMRPLKKLPKQEFQY